jgi:molybdopterin/thiamine biosynthesis adenylyltransferase
LINFGDECKEVELIYFSHTVWGDSALLAESKTEGEKWLIQSGASLEQKSKKVLYLPINSIGLPPFPANNRDIISKLKQYSPRSVLPLLEFLNRNPRPTTIVFSIPGSSGKIFGVWEHGITKEVITKAFKGKKRVNNSLKGFRPNKKNAFLELTRDFSKLKIKKQSIIRVDKDRLFNRGGDGIVAEGRVGIIGCGSIGSQIARSLVEIGIDKFLLIDQDTLTFENIARHICGASDVGKLKVEALKQLFTSHFPNCEITTYSEEIINLLLSYEIVLNRSDFSVVAIGHLPTELRLNQLLKQNVIDKPILYVWVEPYLAGAHAIWIDPNNQGCLECVFDQKHDYLQNVLDMPGQYSKRESGCQSAFVPYGVLEVKRFTNDLLFFIHDILSGKFQNNMVFTWLGNLTEQRKNGRKVSSKWAGADNYSIRTFPIKGKLLCEGCSQ